MDDETLSIILELQLEDVEERLSESKGKHVAGTLSDAEVALQLHRDDLRNQEVIAADRRMGRSISHAVQNDSGIIAQARLAESNSFRDRELAFRLGGVTAPSKSELGHLLDTTANEDEDLISRLGSLNTWDPSQPHDSVDSEDEKGSSSRKVQKGDRSTSKRERCVACQESKPAFDIIQAPCEHRYCRECIGDLFETATTDESLFPPRCCRQNIPVDTVKDFLSKALIERVEQKRVEFGTPNRTYCVWPTCSAFIPPDRIDGDVAVCLDCEQTTCTVCKSAAHEGDCPNDTALQSLISTAEENNWQRCYQCRRLIELEIGCYHMTCHCRAEFCYLCGSRWKTCDCPQWDEDRLRTRAHQVVARDPRPNNAVPAQQRFQDAVNQLRERHECAHTGWRYVRGPHQCEECTFNLPQYIFECTQCGIQACNRCRRNRL